jgi:hypothetical protein
MALCLLHSGYRFRGLRANYEDYARAEEEVRGMGFDPNTILRHKL